MSTFTIFCIVIGAAGLLLLGGSLLFGGDAEIDGGVEADANSGDSKTASSSILSVVSAGMVGFGATGWIVNASGIHWLVALLCGLAGGAALAAVVHYVLSLLASKQSNSMASRQSYVGSVASVTLSIPQDGFGEVVFHDAVGVRVSERARSNDGTAIPTGVTVTVMSVTEGGVTVAIPSLTP